MERLFAWARQILWVASALAVAYCAWVFTGRIVDHRKLDERVRGQGVNPEFNKLYGGQDVRILHFYASDGAILSGQRTLLCYGVVNATSIRLEPEVPGVYPSVGRCVESTPKNTTTYKLTADGAKGGPISQSVTVVVSPLASPR